MAQEMWIQFLLKGIRVIISAWNGMQTKWP